MPCKKHLGLKNRIPCSQPHLSLQTYLLVAKNWNPGATFKQSPRPGISNSLFSKSGISTEIWREKKKNYKTFFFLVALTDSTTIHTSFTLEMLEQCH